jgi:hypothetical protein
MITYVFPPDGSSSGMLRPLKFCRYLDELGWTVSILTARNEDYLLRDDTLLPQIPSGVNVCRSFAPNSRKYFYFRGKSLSILSFPDRVLWWWPFAYKKGIEVIKNINPQVLWSTSPMITTNLIAYSLKKRTGLPWIADFRDPWIHITDTGWQRTINEYLERKVMHFADAVVVTTEWMKREILNRIPELPDEKVHVICNGYDEDDFADLTPAAKRPDSPFILVYTGLLDSTYRNPESLFMAVSLLRKKSILPRQGFQIDFYGCSEYLSQPTCQKMIESLGLSDIVSDCGRVSRKQSLQVLVDADALLLIQDADMTRSAIPAKAFDYLRTGKPIIALASEGATTDLLDTFKRCILIKDTKNEQLISNGLEEMFASECHKFELDNDIEQYSRKKLTAQLASLMDGLLS